MKRTLLVAGVATILLAWTGVGRRVAWEIVTRSIASAFPEVPTISAEALAASLPAPVLLDVRAPEEFATSHLPGAIHAAPGGPLPDLPRDTTIVVYCSVGYRSARLAQRLSDAGYTDVRNLEGSIFRWANEGRPLVHAGQPTTRVHPYSRWWGLLLRADRRAVRSGHN